MKILQSLKLLTTIGVFSSAIFFASCKKSTPQPAIVEKNNIAYIYKTDNTDALAYKALLEENDCHVTLIDKATISSNNYSSYQLIVIDNNTDGELDGGTWTNAETATLQASGKPMLLIGIGGLQYAKKINNASNFSSSAMFNESKFFVADKSSVLYKQPYVISVPTSTPAVTLYSSNVLAAGTFVATGQTIADVTLVGRFAQAAQYYPLTFEKDRYTTFGFTKGVNDMNQSGKDFMVNMAFFVGRFDL